MPVTMRRRHVSLSLTRGFAILRPIAEAAARARKIMEHGYIVLVHRYI